MKTKKITLNELRTLIKQIIKEESDPYNGELENILADIKKLKSPITNESPEVSVMNGFIYVHDDDYFINFFGRDKNEYNLYIHPELWEIANKYDMDWDWQDPYTISLRK